MPDCLIETRDGILCRFPVITIPGDMEVTYSVGQVPQESSACLPRFSAHPATSIQPYTPAH